VKHENLPDIFKDFPGLLVQTKFKDFSGCGNPIYCNYATSI